MSQPIEDFKPKPIPVTVVAGFLGAERQFPVRGTFLRAQDVTRRRLVQDAQAGEGEIDID